MKTMTALIAAAALSALSFGAFAESVSATSSTLDGAQAKIAAKAKAAGASSYTITSAVNNNRVYMSAELNK
ncbi:YdgH/BhsA/McbA-like domain containing protein [Tatumella sp. UBA2305]|uniref:YdgH/BhsA/McbA-like domain containing protein n=1 Tax=Tatumella sp. UBA2305 TaxID=1947647 RepID=UPI0025D6C675|nr:YdgH/BhsA/McbA-like domain containing protein [Tatumella sp. UBA2305]